MRAATSALREPRSPTSRKRLAPSRRVPGRRPVPWRAEAARTRHGACREPRLLLLDEPMAGLGHARARQMLDLLAGLKGRIGMLLVEHDMEAVFALADRISVLVYGRVIATGDADGFTAIPRCGSRIWARGTPDARGRSLNRPMARARYSSAWRSMSARARSYVARSQRNGQDDDHPDHHGPDAGHGGRIAFDGARSWCDAGRHRGRGIGLVPEGRHIFPT